MKILITGASGLIGTALVKYFRALGHQVEPLCRSKKAIESPFWDPERAIIELGSFTEIDVVIHLAGENIAEGRWSNGKKSRIYDSRVKGTKLLADMLAALDHKPHTLISVSAIGYYGDGSKSTFDEGSRKGTGFLASVCAAWEKATDSAEKAGIRVITPRIGVVLSTQGGALQKMLLPFKMGFGGRIGDGEQYLSWISLPEIVRIFLFLIKNTDFSGPVNLVSPTPATNIEFSKTLGKVLHRPAVLPIPEFVIRSIFGEMGVALLLSSSRVIPDKLLKAGYDFQHPNLHSAIQYIMDYKV